MHPLTLADWLNRLEQLHPTAIDLGLERCGEVARRLGLINTTAVTLTVAGTNGKGSTVAVMESLLRATGNSCGAFTSPHLNRYNERIRVDGCEVADAQIVAAFEAIECARQNISLTYFEFGTLAALWVFKELGVSYQLLEVGLGGRLDAVNVIDSNVAVVTAIGLDHQEWLGSDVDTIAIEKCGIARQRQRCVVADYDPPVTVVPELQRIGAEISQAGVDYTYDALSFSGSNGDCLDWELPPGLLGINAAAGVEALGAVGIQCNDETFATAMAHLNLRGRREHKRVGEVSVIMDVAHNPAATAKLRDFLRSSPTDFETVAIFGVMSDKDCGDMMSIVEEDIDFWCLPAGLGGLRGQDPNVLADLMNGRSQVFSSFDSAFRFGMERLSGVGRLVVFGSFFTVGEGVTALNTYEATTVEDSLC